MLGIDGVSQSLLAHCLKLAVTTIDLNLRRGAANLALRLGFLNHVLALEPGGGRLDIALELGAARVISAILELAECRFTQFPPLSG